MRTLQYVVMVLVGGFLVWLRIKSFISKRETSRDINNLTQDLLTQKKSAMSQEDYKKWLRKINTIIQARLLENKSRGLNSPPYLESALTLTNEEKESLGIK